MHNSKDALKSKSFVCANHYVKLEMQYSMYGRGILKNLTEN